MLKPHGWISSIVSIVSIDSIDSISGTTPGFLRNFAKIARNGLVGHSRRLTLIHDKVAVPSRMPCARSKIETIGTIEKIETIARYLYFDKILSCTAGFRKNPGIVPKIETIESIKKKCPDATPAFFLNLKSVQSMLLDNVYETCEVS